MEKIYEYAYDQPTLEISRWVVKAFKELARSTRRSASRDFAVFGYRVPVTVNLYGDRNSVVAIAGAFGPDGIKIDIQFNFPSLETSMENIVARIKEVIRHELEHAGQNFKSGKEPITGETASHRSTSDELFQYYTSSHEVPAFVKGFLKYAKTRKTSLSDEIDNFVDGTLTRTKLTPEQREIVRETYKKYASTHLQKYESKMNGKVNSFVDFLNENGLKALVGKGDNEDLTVQDAKRIGKKISSMKGKDRQKYIGIVNFMGASCKVFNEIWANYKPVDRRRKAKNNRKDYEKDLSQVQTA